MVSDQIIIDRKVIKNKPDSAEIHSPGVQSMFKWYKKNTKDTCKSLPYSLLPV